MRILNHLKPEASVALVIPTPSTEDEAISKKKISHLLMTSKMQTILLNKLAANGISLDDCSVLAFSQIRHPQVDTMTNDEFRCWQELLRRDLEKLPNCKLIISVGEMPLRALANVANISKYQGAPINCTLVANKLVLPIDSYTFAMGNPDWFPLTDFFLQKASRYKSMTTKPWKTINTIVTKDDILLEQEFLHADYEWLAFDIECSQYEMTCIGFAKDERTAYVIPLVHCYGNRLGRLLQTIQRILARQDTKKLAQNGNFDITYLAYHYKISVANFAWDTMLAMHSMFPNLPKDLGTLNAIFADEPYWKDDGKQWRLSYDKVNWSQFFEYNGRDTANLLTIRANQEQLLRARGTEATFQQEMALCKPLIFMELIGVDIDQSKQQELEAEAMRNIACWELYLQTILGNLACNVRSPKQLLKLLYTDLKLPKRVRNSKLSTDIDALVSLIPFAPEIIKPIIILKSWLKENSEYKVKTNDDGKMRTTFKPGGTLTGRLSSSKSITGSGCVLGDSMVFTKTGWVAFEDYQTGMETLVWNHKTREYSWEFPEKVVFDHDDLMIKFSNLKHECCYTQQHSLPIVSRHLNTVSSKPAVQFLGKECIIRASGKYTDGKIDFPYIRLLVALHADGSYECGKYRIAFKKSRKIDKFIQLCNELNVPYSEQVARPGYRRFAVDGVISKLIFSYLGEQKIFGDWLLTFTYDTLLAFIEELAYWDSHKRGKSYIFFSVKQQDALWVQNIAHFTNHTATFYKRANNTSLASYGKASSIYAVNVKPNQTVYNLPGCSSTYYHKGKVYCLITSTGYFPCKTNDKIVITGNTNFQNRSKKLRQYFVPDRQKNEIMIQADYSKAESWVVACLAQDMKMLEALYGEDFHSTNASNILGKPVTKANYDDRQLGKRISHACWTGEAEVLTPSGWLRLDQLDDTTEIAVWDKDTNGIHFERPSHMTRANYSGKLHALNGTSYSHLVTPNHRMIFHTYDKQWRIEEASEFVKRKSARLPIAGVKVDSSHFIDEAMLALAIAIQADGRLQCGKVRFRLKKERKIARLLYWLKDIKYTSVIDNDKVTNIYINQSDIAPAMEMLNSNKTFNWEKFLSLPASLMTFVCNEVIHWDGNDSNDGRNRLTYCSTIKSNVELIQTLSHLTGYQALLRKSSAVGKQDLYTVSFNARQLARLESMAISTIDYTGQVYCPTVSTGAFLVRRKDKIQISMNSNYGMTAFLLQSVLLRDGYNYSIGQCQEFIESYFMTYPKIRSNYHQWVQDELRRDRTLTNAFGRKITFWEPWGNSLFNAAYAWIPQGTVGDMTNKALINIYETIPEVALKIQVHDSIVMTTNQDNLNQDLIDKITSCMVMPLTIKGITINIPIDIEVGYNWYNLTDWNKFKEAI